jgi:polysaccharide biosynthesis protein VpsQ
MKYIFIRFSILILPVLYMYAIWQQTSHFDPESVSGLSTVLNPFWILAIGIMLEIGHLFEFGILYFLLIIVFLSYGDLKKWMEVIVLTISLLFGITDEIHQIFVPFRSFSVIDLIKNAVGVIVIACIIHNKYFTNKRSKLSLFLWNYAHYFKRDKSTKDI